MDTDLDAILQGEIEGMNVYERFDPVLWFIVKSSSSKEFLHHQYLGDVRKILNKKVLSEEDAKIAMDVGTGEFSVDLPENEELGEVIEKYINNMNEMTNLMRERIATFLDGNAVALEECVYNSLDVPDNLKIPPSIMGMMNGMSDLTKSGGMAGCKQQ